MSTRAEYTTPRRQQPKVRDWRTLVTKYRKDGVYDEYIKNKKLGDIPSSELKKPDHWRNILQITKDHYDGQDKTKISSPRPPPTKSPSTSSTPRQRQVKVDLFQKNPTSIVKASVTSDDGDDNQGTTASVLRQKLASAMKMDDPSAVSGVGRASDHEHKHENDTKGSDDSDTESSTKTPTTGAPDTGATGTSGGGAPGAVGGGTPGIRGLGGSGTPGGAVGGSGTGAGAGTATGTPSGDADNNPCNSGDIQKNSEFNQAEGEAAPAGSGQIGAGTRNGAVPVQQQTVKAVPPFTMGATPNDSGDKIMDVPDRHTEQGNLRQEYGMEKAQKVIPTVEDQMASDIRFDMFDTVNPGFGEGQDNKLFVMEQNRDAKIVYAKPMFQPGSYIGPIAGVDVPPWQLQRVMPKEKVQRYGEEKKNSLNTMVNVVMTNGAKSTNLLGDDVGYPYDHSACELKRKRLSPLEPVIRTDMNWEHVKDPIGVQLNKHKFRRYTDSQRYPRHLETQTAGIGGQHLSKRRGLEVILQ